MAGTIDITKNTDEDTYFFYCDSLRMDYCRNLGIEGWVFAQNPAGNLDCTCQGGTTGKNVLNEDCSCDNNQPTEYGLGGKPFYRYNHFMNYRLQLHCSAATV